MVKIEKNIPMPVRRGRESKWPLDKMQIGDSFAFLMKDRGSVRNAVSHRHVTKKGKIQFAVRKVNEKELRCWRVK